MNKILAVAVHPDDETLGCGGTLLKHKTNGDEIYWLIITTIDKNRPYFPKRQEEIERVAKLYDFDGVYNLEIPTQKVDECSMSELIGKVSKVINGVQPHTIYLPFKNDVHSDHRVVFDAVYSCTKSFRYPFVKRILMMETISESEFAPSITSESFVPNVFVDISEFFEKKMEIMRVYESELSNHPFPRSEKNLEALAILRGATGGGSVCGEFYVAKGDSVNLKNTAFFSVVFQGLEPFLKDYFDSLLSQTCLDFDLYLVNDGMENLDKFFPTNPPFNIFILDFSDTPAKIRENGINILIEKGYKNIIFGDADDYFEKNRVEISLELLDRFDIVVNDFDIVDESGVELDKNYLSNRFENLKIVEFEDIKNKNFMGMTNTAIRAENLKKFDFHKDIVALDWMLFSILLLENKKAIFTNKMKTFYRRHGFNVIGINAIDNKKILKGIEIKALHYEELSISYPKLECFYICYSQRSLRHWA